VKIAITGADGLLGQRLTTHLATAGHDVRGVDADVDVLDVDSVTELCVGMDRVVHLARSVRQPDAPAAAEDGRLLDTALKGTWNILHAARDAGVRQVVQISDVCIYAGYDEDHILSEDMVPLPDTSAEQQALHLAEGVAHEFAREVPGSVLTLRLGRLVDVTNLPAAAPLDRDWLDVEDAASAIARGLELDSYDHPSHWGLYNVVADTPYRRFSLRIMAGRFAFSPGVDFRAWWPKSEGMS
jgi:uronate dehydrogenase